MFAQQDTCSNMEVISSQVMLYDAGSDSIGVNFNILFDNTNAAVDVVRATVVGLTTAFPGTEVAKLNIATVANEDSKLPDCRNSLLAELQEIKEECSIDAWASPTSKAIPHKTCDMVKEMIALFPSYLIDPEITPENDGVLGLEWRNEQNYFDMAVTSNGVIYYIAKIHGRKNRGSFDHDPLNLPVLMMTYLGQLFPEE